MALYPAPDMRTGAISIWVAGAEEAERASEIVRGLGHVVSVVAGECELTRASSPADPLRGTLAPPPDKSISHRAAIVAAMADGETRISNYLDAADTNSTLDAVRALGAAVERGRRAGRPSRRVSACAARDRRSIDVGNAGTLLRLLPGWLAGQPAGEWSLDGDESIRRRPVDRVVEPLRRMGAEISRRATTASPR